MSLPEDPVSGSKTKIEFSNYTGRVLEVTVEVYPNRYVLQPGDEFVLLAELDRKESRTVGWYTINLYDGGVQIYAGWDFNPLAFINGLPVDSDWETPSKV